jgi:uncharacterized protein (DUF1501 family)
MGQSRREFLRRTSCAALGMAAFQAGVDKFGLMSALAQRSGVTDYRALVCVFLDGGNDGNNMIVPLDTAGYASYASIRASPGLAIPPASLLPISPRSIGRPFGFHPGMPELHALWNQQKLAVVANVGPLLQPLTQSQYRSGAPRPSALFSHSDQTALWQSPRSDTSSLYGWGGRTGDLTAAFNSGSTFPIVSSIAGQVLFALGQSTQPIALTPAPTPLNQVLVLSGFDASPESLARRSAFDYLRTIDQQLSLVAAASSTTQQAVDAGRALAVDPTLTTVFPASGLGNQLKQVAKLIKLNLTGTELNLNRQIFFTKIGGFDTHQDQLGNQSALLGQLSAAMSAFYAATVELGVENRVTAFTLSEFGRTLEPSGSASTVGSDHGWGNHHLVMGGPVLGGDFYGVAGSNGTVFPSLQLDGPDDADNRGRWIPTASVEQYAATLAAWLGVQSSDLPILFPLIGRFTTPNLGFLP